MQQEFTLEAKHDFLYLPSGLLLCLLSFLNGDQGQCLWIARHGLRKHTWHCSVPESRQSALRNRTGLVPSSLSPRTADAEDSHGSVIISYFHHFPTLLLLCASVCRQGPKHQKKSPFRGSRVLSVWEMLVTQSCVKLSFTSDTKWHFATSADFMLERVCAPGFRDVSDGKVPPTRHTQLTNSVFAMHLLISCMHGQS